MYKPRKIKILSILALVVSIIGMTLWFAAFSSTLTISSSATVSPNSENLVDEACQFIVRGILVFSGQSWRAIQQNYNGTLDYEEYNSTLEQDCFLASEGVCKLAKEEELVLVGVVEYSSTGHSEGDNYFGVRPVIRISKSDF